MHCATNTSGNYGQSYPLYPSLHRQWAGVCKAYINGLVQDCGNSIVLAMVLPESGAKPSFNQGYMTRWKMFWLWRSIVVTDFIQGMLSWPTIYPWKSLLTDWIAHFQF